MAGRLGNHAAILSRIGRDDLGRNAIKTRSTHSPSTPAIFRSTLRMRPAASP